MKQRQSSVWVCVIMIIVAICLLTESKSLILKLIIERPIFELGFV